MKPMRKLPSEDSILVKMTRYIKPKLPASKPARVLAITEDIMFKWRLLLEEGRKAGHTFSQPDLIIAATALHRGLTVVSRDINEYALAQVEVQTSS